MRSASMRSRLCQHIASVYECLTLGKLVTIRVVLWPQSARTSGGPPDSGMWWSGGLLEIFNH